MKYLPYLTKNDWQLLLFLEEELVPKGFPESIWWDMQKALGNKLLDKDWW